ncbi:hypothetical protein [Nocardia sp. NPDC047648]|uniref:hypothetical protein n=1 Tax=Nocardia sp. NPDC047648 TaxID=3155625 RepID=UPI0033C239E8
MRFTEHVILHGPADQRLDIKSGNTSHRTTDHGKLFICRDYAELGTHLDPGQGIATITVSETRPTEAIAARITRDLLPGFVETLARCRARALKAAQTEAGRMATIEALCAALPSARRVQDSHVYFGRVGSSLSGRIRVHDNRNATIHIEATWTHALALARAIGNHTNSATPAPTHPENDHQAATEPPGPPAPRHSRHPRNPPQPIPRRRRPTPPAPRNPQRT